jgi:alanine transaminase
MVKPPQKGEESYEVYTKEKDQILGSLKRRADKLTSFLNTLPGIKCNPAEGAMYAFPQIHLPHKFIQEAEKAGKKPDTYYALELLEKTGLCAVPGSGFGQKHGTWHFRTTFLPAEDKIDAVMQKLGKFQAEFMDKYK